MRRTMKPPSPTSTTPRDGAPNVVDLAAATPEHPIALGPYDVTGLLGEGGMGRVYDAVARDHGVRVALKTLSRMAPESLLRFKSEFRSVAGISHPNLVPLYELGCHEDLWFFTMERVDGSDFLTGVRGPRSAPSHQTETELRQTTLTVPAATVPTGRSRGRVRSHEGSPSLPPSLPRLRDALVQLAGGLHALHEAGFVHLDVKPSNVLVDRSGRVVVLDFGLVQAIPGTILEPAGESQRERTIRGTPLWMAPEQFVGVAVGEAADWYAVGLLLYEALTGLPAFPPATASATFYARQHLTPPPPLELLAGVPEDLSALCAALLRPDPAARPTGAALLEMLRGDPHVASVRTAPARSGFVGRETERERLHAAFQRSRTEGAVVAHVTGPSGVGKTALLRCFTDAVREAGALVLTGRCYERETVPYKAFDGIVDDLAARLADRPDDEVAPQLPARIVALGRVFPVLATVPAVAARLDAAVEDSTSASAIELRRRAVQALGELLRKLAVRQPVVLQIDDLHWADADSIELLLGLLDAAPVGVLVAASFRREEAAENPALARYLPEGGPGARGITTIDLTALPPASAEALAVATLSALDLPPDSLAGAIAAESGGIPFFVEELAHYAARHGVAATGRHRMEGVTLETVLARRVQELPDAERALVEALSVANSPIPISVWFSVAGVDPGALRALWALRGSHFVRSTGAAADDLIELHHDRMRQSVLSYMSPAQIVDYHLRLGWALAARHEEEGTPWLFAAVRHLGEAASRLDGPERVVTARLHLLAGRRARETAAFPLAFDCFRAGIRLLDDTAWDAHYDLALGLHSGAAESAYLSAAWEEVDAHVATVRAHGRTILDQLVAREVQIDACIARREYGDAVEAALQALRLLDVDLPASPGDAEIGAAFQAATESLSRVEPVGLLGLPMADDPRVTAAMRLMSRMSSAAYFARPALLPVIGCRLVATSVEHGLCPATPFALSVYGIVLNAVGLLREAHTWGTVALDLLDRIPDKSQEARTRHVVNDLVCVFTVPLAGTLDALRAVVDIGKENGDLEYAAYAAHAFVHNAFYAGRELSSLLDEAVLLGASMRGYGQVNALHVHTPFEQVLRCFLGATPDPASLDDAAFAEEAALASARADGSRSGQNLVHMLMGLVRYHFGAAVDAVRHLEEARPFLDGVSSTWHVPIFHEHAALAVWALPEASRLPHLAAAEESLAALRHFAEHGPENFAHRVSLVEAEKARASGDPSAARQAYGQAIAGAAANGFLGDEGLGHELFARALRAEGAEAEAAQHEEAAREVYARWGAKAKVARLS
jgi:predicted ATPase/serine/threonine protein kinase